MRKYLLILMLMLIPAILSANGLPAGASEDDYFFKVENTTMVDAYYNVFNAIAAIFGSGTYYDLIKLVFLLGGFFVFAGGVLATVSSSSTGSAQGTVTGYAKYYVTATALLIVIFSTKSTIWVTSETIPSFCSDTASPNTGTAVEIPSVLAFTFSTANSLGRELTIMSESVMSPPSATGGTGMFDQGGFAGAIKNAKALIEFNPNDITLREYAGEQAIDFNTGWQTFFSKCVYEVSGNKGPEGIQRLADMEKSGNLQNFIETQHLNTPFAGSTRTPGESLVEMGGQNMTCNEFYNSYLIPSVTLLKDKAACGLRDVNSGALKIISGDGTLGASNFEAMAVQAGLIHNLRESKKITGVGVQSGYVSGKTLAEQNQANISTAGYMAEVLPYVQMTMRAILYGFFPFVFIIVLLPGGLSVLKSYGQTMAWIELWGPTAAVVNMFVNLKAESELSSRYSAEGLTMVSAVDMSSEASTVAGVASLLYLSIPALTWLILKGSGQMLGNVTAGMASKFTQNLSSQAVNKDVTALEKQKEAESKLGKAVSYAEAQHYESRAMGLAAGGALAAQIKTGLGYTADAANQQEGAKLIEAKLNKNSLGTNENVSLTKAKEGNIKTTSDSLVQSEVKDSTRIKTQSEAAITQINSDERTQKELSRDVRVLGKSATDVIALDAVAGSLNQATEKEQAKAKASKAVIDTKTVNQVTEKIDEQTQANIGAADSLSTLSTKDQFQDKTGQKNDDGSANMKNIKSDADTVSEKQLVDLKKEKSVQSQYNTNERAEDAAKVEVGNLSQQSTVLDNQKEQWKKDARRFQEEAPRVLGAKLNELDDQAYNETMKRMDDLYKQKGVNINSADVQAAKDYDAIKKRKESDSYQSQHDYIMDIENFAKKHGIELEQPWFGAKQVSEKDTQRFEKALASQESLVGEAKQIASDVREEYDQKKSNMINKFASAGFVNVDYNENGQAIITRANKDIGDISNKEMGEKLAGHFSSVDSQGYETENYTDAVGNRVAVMRKIKNGRIDKDEYGSNTAALARQAGVSEDILYTINSTNNVITTASKAVLPRMVKGGFNNIKGLGHNTQDAVNKFGANLTRAESRNKSYANRKDLTGTNNSSTAPSTPSNSGGTTNSSFRDSQYNMYGG